MTDQPGSYDFLRRDRVVYPRENREFEDLDNLIEEFIVDKTISPFFTKESRFFTQGSCFAENLHNALQGIGYRTYHNEMVEALNSPVANAVYLTNLAKAPDDAVSKELRAADVFILTVGVAPCWFLKATGEFVFQPDTKRIDEYFHRTPPVMDIRDALLHALEMARQINPSLRVVLTLSPVPLGRTFEFGSAIVGDAVSKSVLRTAIHEALMASPEEHRPLYFPSFEIVRWAGAHRGDAFGDDGLPRHVSKHYVEAIIRAFIRNYGIDDSDATADKG